MMLVGAGNSLMACNMEDAGFTESIVISNPTYSTLSLANTNFSGLKVIPLLEQCSKNLHVFQKLPSTVLSHWHTSSMHLTKSLVPLKMSSILLEYASDDANQPIGHTL